MKRLLFALALAGCTPTDAPDEAVVGGTSASDIVIVTNAGSRAITSISVRELMRDGSEGVEFASQQDSVAPGDTTQLGMVSGGCGRMNVVVTVSGRTAPVVTPINTCSSGAVTITD